MKGKYIFLAALLALSGTVVALIGAVVKYAILEPMGLERQETVVALPFVLLRDEGLRYVITDLRTVEETPATVPEEPSINAQPETEPAAQESAPTAQTEQTVPLWNALEQVLFIGDSRTCALRDQARLEGADYFCDVGMSVFNVGSSRLSDEDFQNQTLSALLSNREYTCVVISLGLNESGYPIDSLIRAYQSLLTDVVRTQPQAVIVLQGVMTVSRSWAESTPYSAPENLDAINQRIRTLADNYRSFYIDPNQRFADEEGYLPDSMTADGCHLYAKYTHLWAQWIYEEIEDLNI